jgi:hypothetical protein
VVVEKLGFKFFYPKIYFLKRYRSRDKLIYDLKTQKIKINLSSDLFSHEF